MKHGKTTAIYNKYLIFDVYIIILTNGKKYYYSTCDIPLTYSNSGYLIDNYKDEQGNYLVLDNKHAIFSRGNIKTSGEFSVDTLSFSIACDGTDIINNKSFMQSVQNGDLTNAKLIVDRWILGENNQWLSATTMFAGIIQLDSAGGLKANFTAKSLISQFNRNIPTRIYAPTTSYYTNNNNVVTRLESDNSTCMIPLKPSNNVLIKF